MAGGRPTDYKIEYNRQVTKLCRLGATDKELAEFFEVSEDTINEWKKIHPEFSVSIKKGKQIADMNVAQRLYERACGYQTKVDKIFQYEGAPVVVPTIEKYPPDPTSMIFWLKNRRPKEWRDKQELELGGDTNVNITRTIISRKV